MHFFRTHRTWRESLSGELKFSDAFIVVNINQIALIEHTSKKAGEEDLWRVSLTNGVVFYIPDVDLATLDKAIVQFGSFSDTKI